MYSELAQNFYLVMVTKICLKVSVLSLSSEFILFSDPLSYSIVV